MTETPRRNLPVVIAKAARRLTLPGLAQPGASGMVMPALRFLAGNPAPSRPPLAGLAERLAMAEWTTSLRALLEARAALAARREG